MQKSFILSSIVLCTLFTVIALRYLDSFSVGFFPLIFSASLVSTLLESDDKSNWTLFVNSFPLAKDSQLKADFLFCYSFTALIYMSSLLLVIL